MLTELYIEALLVDESLTKGVWSLWDAGFIADDLAAIAWWLIWVQAIALFYRSPEVLGSSTN